jgi:hypothetical protein
VEALTVTESVLRVKITGAGSKELEMVVREALFEHAPDAVEVIIEGGKGRAGGSNFVPLSSLQPAVSLTRS